MTFYTTEVINGSNLKIPGPARLVSMKLRISLPTVPTRSPSPEQTTLPASATAVTATLSGQPFTCLQIECTVLKCCGIQCSQKIFYMHILSMYLKETRQFHIQCQPAVQYWTTDRVLSKCRNVSFQFLPYDTLLQVVITNFLLQLIWLTRANFMYSWFLNHLDRLEINWSGAKRALVIVPL